VGLFQWRFSGLGTISKHSIFSSMELGGKLSTSPEGKVVFVLFFIRRVFLSLS
jgi:hypothetical protein